MGEGIFNMILPSQDGIIMNIIEFCLMVVKLILECLLYIRVLYNDRFSAYSLFNV